MAGSAQVKYEHAGPRALAALQRMSFNETRQERRMEGPIPHTADSPDVGCRARSVGSTTFGREFLERIWGNVGYWEVEDMVAARSWLVSEQISEPTLIFVTGSSYGGYLTLQALGTKPTLWAGGMAAIAVGDWVIAQEDTTATLRGLRAARFGGTPDEYPERYTKSSPLTYAADVSAPVLIIQGRTDTQTPPRSIAVYEERMKTLGKDINVHWFDTGHGSLVVEQIIEQHELMLEFARRVTQIPSID